MATREIGVAHLTALDMPAVAFVRAARTAGYSAVGLRVVPAMPGGAAYPTVPGTAAHAELRTALDGEGIRLADIEFVQLTPDFRPESCTAILEAGADLGASSLTVSGDDPDPARLAANLHALAEIAQRHAIRIDLEFMRWRVVPDLAAARAAVRRAAHGNLGILIDALHLSRSGGAPSDLDAQTIELVRTVQICDAGPILPADDAAAIAEARGGRLPPGEGTLPLLDLVARMPQGTFVSVELPMAGVAFEQRLSRGYAAARRLLG